MIVLVATWYPPHKTGELIKKFVALNKAQLGELGITKWMNFSTTGGKDGNKTYSLIFTDKEKGEDALKNIIRRFVPPYKVEGFRYRIEILLNFTDGIDVIAGWDKL